MSEEQKGLFERKVSKPIKKQVTALYKKSGELIGSDEENSIIDILQFETDHLASVSAKFGVTISMGAWESCRFDAMVTVPCYIEEIDSAMKFAEKKAEEYTRAQASEYLSKKAEDSKGE